MGGQGRGVCPIHVFQSVLDSFKFDENWGAFDENCGKFEFVDI
jgi:hypothetical protein